MIFPLIASLFSTVLGTVGIIQQGKARKASAKFEAKQIENQRINDELETKEEIRRQRIRNRKDLATQKLAQIKSGFSSEAGSPLELRAETVANQELEIQDRVRAQSARSQQARGREALSIFEGKSASQASKIGAGARLLKGGADAFSIFKANKKTA